MHREQMPKPPRLYYCYIAECARLRGFTRKDNLLDHQRRVHNADIPKRKTQRR